jgi:hypothetical protein
MELSMLMGKASEEVLLLAEILSLEIKEKEQVAIETRVQFQPMVLAGVGAGTIQVMPVRVVVAAGTRPLAQQVLPATVLRVAVPVATCLEMLI